MIHRRKIAAFFLGLMLLLSAPGAAEAATYYVATNGNDSSNGSQAAPFRTIAHAVSKMVAGDTTYVRGGVYSEPPRFGRSGTASAPIKLLNAPGESPVIDCGRVGTKLIVFQNGESELRLPIGHITVEGFEIRNCWFGMAMSNGYNITIRRNWIHDNAAQGMHGSGKNILVDRNVISHNGDFAGCAAGKLHTPGDPSNGTVCNKHHGIYTIGPNWTITNNLIYANLAIGVAVAGYEHCPGKVCPSGSKKYTKEFADASYGGADGWLIANNTIAYNGNGPGINLWQSLATNNKIINNILYENGQKYLSSSKAQGISFTSSGGGHLIQNNICYATGPGGAACIEPGEESKYTASNNLVNTANPNFVNAPATIPASPDFGLKPGSPAIDKGQTLSYVVEDHDGNARPAGAGYDIGAYEGGSIPRICSIVGTAVAVPTSVIDPATGQPPTRPGYILLGVVPPGFTLSAGAVDQTVSGGSVYRLSLAQLSGLTLTPPADFKGTVKIEAFFVPQ